MDALYLHLHAMATWSARVSPRLSWVAMGRQAMSIQYHPEASPGPHDSDICFDQFIAMLEEEQGGAKPTKEEGSEEKPPMIAV